MISSRDRLQCSWLFPVQRYLLRWERRILLNIFIVYWVWVLSWSSHSGIERPIIMGGWGEGGSEKSLCITKGGGGLVGVNLVSQDKWTAPCSIKAPCSKNRSKLGIFFSRSIVNWSLKQILDWPKPKYCPLIFQICDAKVLSSDLSDKYLTFLSQNIVSLSFR